MILAVSHPRRIFRAPVHFLAASTITMYLDAYVYYSFGTFNSLDTVASSGVLFLSIAVYFCPLGKWVFLKVDSVAVGPECDVAWCCTTIEHGLQITLTP